MSQETKAAIETAIQIILEIAKGQGDAAHEHTIRGHHDNAAQYSHGEVMLECAAAEIKGRMLMAA